MVPINKEPGSRVDHGEWIIQESEEPAARAAAHAHESTAARSAAPGFLTAALIIVLLGITAVASVMAPILAQRPWVGPSNGHEEVLQGLAAGHAMKVRVTLKNSGRTPALKLRVAIRLLIGNPPPAPSPVLAECGYASAALPQSVLFPDATYSKTVATEQQIDDGTVAAVLRNDKTVYLTGCAQYDDSIMQWMHLNSRQTHFCRIFVPASAGNLGILGTFEDCPAGNSAD
jgi:hypothetical protein